MTFPSVIFRSFHTSTLFSDFYNFRSESTYAKITLLTIDAFPTGLPLWGKNIQET